MLKLVLLDRDGVINHQGFGYVQTPADWQPIEGSSSAIARLNARDVIVAVCSNQSAIGRGIITREMLGAVNETMTTTLAAAGAHLDRIFICPHHPNADCSCRKPKPGMLCEAISAFNVTPAETCFIGDSLSDMKAALAANCMPILVLTGHGRRDEIQARRLGLKRVHENLSEAVSSIVI